MNDSKTQLQHDILTYILSTNGIVHEPELLDVYAQLKKKELNEANVLKLQTKLDRLIGLINESLHSMDYKIEKYRQYTPMALRTISSASIGSTIANDSTNDGSSTRDAIDLKKSNLFYVYTNLKLTQSSKLATFYKPTELEFVKYVFKKLMEPNELSSIKDLNLSNDKSVSYKQYIDKIIRLDHNNEEDGTSSIGSGTYTSFNKGSTSLIVGFRNSDMNVDSLKLSDLENILTRLCENKWLTQYGDGSYSLYIRSLVELKDYIKCFDNDDGSSETERSEEREGTEGEAEELNGNICNICQKIVYLGGIECSNCNSFYLDIDCLKQFLNRCHNSDQSVICSYCKHEFNDVNDIIYIL
ncbi:Smc5-Smc6 complex subunit NSE1 SCDLUD_004557 [Saccharomycodes ludwigii]|uniref:Smc5-Smc6 complex subunit NSE1 n=1 Tax=Saccharomycodes ludwigii TaxID=36035 RepID=UPI001E8AB081|nr:hypothetical protein SCDLUD_004557 [Saccharomycodes ludwigii]KAH3899131.1 hypothetical protein SCDLUD_004557 [Saccharomycodes ludwigii]